MMSESNENAESNMLLAHLESHPQCFVNATYRVMRIMDEVKAAPEIVALGDVEVE